MAVEEENQRMKEEFKRWLEHRGIALKDVMLPFTVKHEYGQTQITFTMIAQDFPVPAFAEGGPVLPIGKPRLFHSNAINRTHPTCIDVTTASEQPHSSWVCGPECPTNECS